MTIGEVAKRSGLTGSAIRYYEKTGVLPAPARRGGQRRYDESVLHRLAVLKRARQCGLSLSEAKGLFEDSGPPSERWQRVASRKIAELDSLMEQIAAMRELLERRCSCVDLDECGRRIAASAVNSELAFRRDRSRSPLPHPSSRPASGRVES